MVELTFNSLPVGNVSRDAFKDQYVAITGGHDKTPFPFLGRWSVVDCAGEWHVQGSCSEAPVPNVA